MGCASPSDDPALSAASDVDSNSEVLVDEEDGTLTDSAVADDEGLRILFLGDSITAGFGIDQLDAFPALVETRLTDGGYNVTAIDAGVSGDTSTGGLNRLDWLLQNPVDILVLELGGNDGLRGIDLSLTRSNLGAIIEQTRETWPGVDVLLVGMEVPPNLGIEYTREFADMYPSLAAEYETAFAPFIGDSFEDVVHLLQSDGIHPTEEGHAVIAEKVTEALMPIVASRQEAS